MLVCMVAQADLSFSLVYAVLKRPVAKFSFNMAVIIGILIFS